MEMQPVMILAGGTGGHVFPALAVATELRQRGVPIIWVGTEKGIESKVVPAAGFQLAYMHVQGLRGKGLIQYLRAPIIISKALLEGLHIVKKYNPCALLGMGGFVSGPCGLIGVILRKPLIIHEQNAVVGLTNRILAPLSKVMFTGFPIQYKKARSEYTGNPVRNELMSMAEPTVRLTRPGKRKRLLIIGGSLGSLALNTVLPVAIKILSQTMQIDVWHQTGANKRERVVWSYQQDDMHVQVDEFINDMSKAYAWADLIICRSGAITLAELAAVGLGSILVPYPYAVDDHQTANARSFVEQGAACLLPESEMTAEKLASLLQTILLDEKRLVEMAKAAKKLSQTNASKRVANACMDACGCHESGEKK